MNKSLQHARLIVNPHSGDDRTEALAAAVRKLEAAGIEVSVCESESESQMISLIKEYPHEDGVIIIAGGDGTVSSALEAVYSCERTLAVFPMGTANDFARAVGVPQDLSEAAQVIITGKRERINLGRVNNQYFVNVAHVGLGVDVTHALNPEVKKHYGVFAYVGAFVKAVKRNKSFKVHIQAEDWHCDVRAVHLAIGNGRFYGGGNIVDEKSTLLDGKLNLFCIKAQPWWKLLLLSPGLRSGNLRKTDRIICKTAEKFSVRTSKPRELEADGEFKTKTPAEFEVLPQALEVIVGEMPVPETP